MKLESFIKLARPHLGNLVATCVALPWIQALFFYAQDKFRFPTFSGDQEIYLIRARAFWDGVDPGQKLNINSIFPDRVVTDDFERIWFSVTGQLFSPFTSFELFFILTALATCFFGTKYLIHFSKKILPSFGDGISTAIFIFLLPEIVLNRNFLNSSLNVIDKWPFPIIHYCLLITAMYLVMIQVKTKTIILSLIILFLSFHTYFYTWQIVFLLLTVGTAFQLFRNFRMKWKIVTTAILCYGITLLSLLIQSNLLSALNNEFDSSGLFEYVIEKQDTQSPTFSKTLLLLLILTPVLWMNSRQAGLKALYINCLTVSFILENQQIITGVTVQPGHYKWYFENLLLGLAALIIFESNLKSKETSKTVVLLFLPILTLGATQTLATLKTTNFTTMNNVQESQPTKNFYTLNYELANRELIMTSNRSYWHPLANFFGATFAENEQAILMMGIWTLNQPTLEKITNQLSKCTTHQEPCGTFRNLSGSRSMVPLREFNKLNLSQRIRHDEKAILGFSEKFANLDSTRKLHQLFVTEMTNENVSIFMSNNGFNTQQLELISEICKTGFKGTDTRLYCSSKEQKKSTTELR